MADLNYDIETSGANDIDYNLQQEETPEIELEVQVIAKGEKGDRGPIGPVGPTPNLTIGTVQTVPHGQSASATITGTPENPVLNMSIPQGASGNETIDDEAGIGDTDLVWSADKTAKEVSRLDGTKADTDNLYAYKTAGPDSVVEVYDAVAEAVKQMQIEIAPVQDLHGYDKPWVGGAGKNLWSGDASFSKDTSSLYSNIPLVLSAGTYTISGLFTCGDTANNIIRFAFRNDSSALTYITVNANSGNRTNNTVTLESACTKVYVYGSNSTSTAYALTATDVQLESGSTATAYEPYSNICPISGFTGCEAVVGTSQFGRTEGAYINASGVLVNDNGFAYSDFITVRKGDTIKICGTKNNSTAQWRRLHIYDENLVWKRQVDAANLSSIGDYTLTGIVAEGEKYIRLSYGIDDTNVNISNVYAIAFPSSAGTVYGGTLTVNADGTGTLVVDWAKIILTGAETWSKESSGNTSFFRRTGFSRPYDASSAIEGYTNKRCSHFKQAQVISSTTDTGFTVYYYPQTSASILNIRPNNVSGISVDDWKAYLAQQNTAETPVVVVYKLSTPTSIPLTAPQIRTILGYNRIYANTGSILSMLYPAERYQTAEQAEKERIHAVVDEPSAVVSVTDGADNVPMGMQIAIEPVQDLHGQSSPYPAGGGKNLFDIDHVGDEWVNTSNQIIHTSAAKSNIINVAAGTTLTLSCNIEATSNYVYLIAFLDSSDAVLSRTVATSGSKVTATAGSNAAKAIAGVYNIDITDAKIQVEIGSNNTAWSPYANICPITGWTGAEISRTGENLIDGTFVQGMIDTNGDVSTNAEHKVSPFISVAAGSKYIIEGTNLHSRGTSDTSPAAIRYAFYDDSKTYISNSRSDADTTSESVLVTAINGAAFVRFMCGNGATDVSFKKENTYSITFPSSAGTVYGGTLTINKDGTGKLVVDRAKITIPEITEFGTSTTGTGKVVNITATGNDSTNRNTKIPIFENAKGVAFFNRGSAWTGASSSSANKILLFVPADITLADANAALQGSGVVYYLTSPVEYTIPAPVIRSLLGTNNVWADTGNVLKLEYAQDLAMMLNDKVNVANYESTIDNIWTELDTKATQADLDDLSDVVDTKASQESVYAIGIKNTLETPGGTDIETFSDGANGISMALTVGIEPVQDKHGYENPWPAGGGVNKLNAVTENALHYSSFNGYTIENGVVTITGNTLMGFIVPVEPSTIYTMSYYKSNNVDQIAARVREFSQKPTAFDSTGYIQQTINTTITTQQVQETFTTTENTQYVIVAVYRSGAPSAELKISNWQLEEGDTRTEWTPYFNICPITGWTGANVSRTGKNLIPDGTDTEKGYKDYKYLSTTGEETTSTNFCISEYFRVKPNTVYAYSVDVSASSPSICFYDENKNFISPGYKLNGNTSIVATSPANAVYARASKYRAGSSAGTKTQLEEGSSATAYEPYAKTVYDIDFPVSAGTVYGGTLTINKDGTGELVVDRATIVVDGTESFIDVTNINAFYVQKTDFTNIKKSDMTDKSNMFKPTTETSTSLMPDGSFSKTSNDSNRLYCKCSAFEGYTAAQLATYFSNNNLQICGRLNTPVEYDLTAPVIRSLLGTNNVWADTGKVLSLDYMQDTKSYIDNLFASLLPAEGVSF